MVILCKYADQTRYITEWLVAHGVRFGRISNAQTIMIVPDGEISPVGIEQLQRIIEEKSIAADITQ